LIPPDDLRRETIVEPLADSGFDLPAALTGIPLGEGVASGDRVPPPPVTARPKDPVRVGDRVQPPTKLLHVDPVYPPVAVAARREGIVILDAVISEDGTVRNVRVLRPEPLFERAAIDAIEQWRFSPTLLNGETVPVVMTVTVRFTFTKQPLR
jgi:protein TonB